MTLRIVSVGREPVEPNGDGSFRQSKVFFWPEPFDQGEHLRGRYTRPYERFRILLRDVWRLAEVPEDDWPNRQAVKWAQKAGCSQCPCSPGFIVARRWGFDLHVMYEDVREVPNR